MLGYFGLTVLILLLGVGAGVLVGGIFWWASRDRRESTSGSGLRLTHWIVFASMGAGAGGFALSANLLAWPGYTTFLAQTLIGALGGALLVGGVLLLARALPGDE